MIELISTMISQKLYLPLLTVFLHNTHVIFERMFLVTKNIKQLLQLSLQLLYKFCMKNLFRFVFSNSICPFYMMLLNFVLFLQPGLSGSPGTSYNGSILFITVNVGFGKRNKTNQLNNRKGM